MISELRDSARMMLNLIESKEFDGVTSVSRETLVDMLTAAGSPHTVYEYDGGFYQRKYLMITGPYTPERVMKYNGRNSEEMKLDLIHDVKNRLKIAAWRAYLSELALVAVLSAGQNGFSINYRHIDMGLLNTASSTGDSDVLLSTLKTFFGYVKDVEVTRLALLTSLTKVDDEIASMKKAVQREGSKNQNLGLSTLFDKKPFGGAMGTDVYTNIMTQVKAAYAAMPSNGLTSRTWGYELEIADAKGVDAPFGIDKGEDGSLRSYESNEDCDCDCSECVYHDCDCDFCDNQNRDPEHCNSSSCSTADMAEFRTKNGISRVKHAGLFKLCKELKEVEAEVNDTCGVHIHVYAQDLSTKQIANVVAGYKWLENIMAIIAGRDDVNYAKRIPVEYVKHLFSGKMPVDKPRAVNLTHVIGDSNYNRGTIEFRQMEGNYDAEAITIWAWTVRGLVEVCKRGAELKNFIQITDFNGLVELYAKFNYMLHDEGADLLIPGGQQDNKYITRKVHERV